MIEIEFEDELCRIWIEKGIVYAVYKTKTIDINIAKNMLHQRFNICNGKVYPLLADITQLNSINKEARDYLGDEGVKLLNANAILIKSSVNRIIGNFYLNITKPKIPTKLFTNKEEALIWLQQFKEPK